jgi:hypothetical protein
MRLRRMVIKTKGRTNGGKDERGEGRMWGKNRRKDGGKDEHI